tara:strand:+ start:461 stop:703 length:243 start_codon:yes stop_codon:yes gene_type:complete
MFSYMQKEAVMIHLGSITSSQANAYLRNKFPGHHFNTTKLLVALVQAVEELEEEVAELKKAKAPAPKPAAKKPAAKKKSK